MSRIPVGRFGTSRTRSRRWSRSSCSEHAGYITGEITDINGGFLID